MKRVVIAISLVALAASAGFGGTRNMYPLYLDMVNRLAYGNFADIRELPGDDLLACSVSATKGTSLYVECQAYQNKVAAYCWSRDPALVATGQALDNESTVYMMWDANNECSYIWVLKGSLLAPKQL